MACVVPVAASHSEAVVTPLSQFNYRLMASLGLTFLDAAGLWFVGLSLYTISSNSLVMRADLFILLLGMVASLSRVWFLTFRVWNQVQSTGLLT
jgi:hypothetical protein